VTAAGIEEGGDEVAIFDHCQSMSVYSKELPFNPYVHEESTKLTNSTRRAAYPRLTDIQNSSADHIWCVSEQGN
jgi:hypothetical protein